MDFKDFRNGVGPYVLGAAAILALLLTLLHVLRNAVHRGTTVNAVYAESAETQWRCSSTQGLRQRDDCIAQRVRASSGDSAPLLAATDVRAP